MALIEMQADLKQTNALLERLVKAVERILVEQYNVRYGHCAEAVVDPNPQVKETVEYASDKALVRQTLMKLAGVTQGEDEGEITQDEVE